MSRRSNSSLFLMEQLAVIIIFAICASACVKIFVDSYLTTIQAKDISNALLVAESSAECYKAVAGDSNQLAQLLGGEEQANGAVFVYYNSQWQPCDKEAAAYILRFSSQAFSTPLLLADLAVQKISGEELVAFPVAVRGAGYE